MLYMEPGYMQQKTTNKIGTQGIGSLGESIAAKYLTSKGYVVLERNYRRKWGEIDLIVKREDAVIFVEVKTVSYETKSKLHHAVTHETWRPEEQVHIRKLHQIEKALATWISETNYTGDWQIDVLGVRIVPRETYATVGYIKNVIV